MVAEITVEFKVEGVRERLAGLEQWLAKAAQRGTGEHEVEQYLFREMLALGGQLLGAFLKLVGPGDLGEEVAMEEGHIVKRWPKQHARRLLTVFGEFAIARWVYGTRPGQKIELMPTDQRLQLPEGDLSYLLQEWDQLSGIDQAFGLVRDTLETVLGLRQSVDTLEHGNRQMAEAAPVFRQAQPAPKPENEGALLVVTEDNKGVPMVRPVEAAPAGCHRKKGEKANKKQMACIGCVYTVDPHVRTAKELVATLFRDPELRSLTGRSFDLASDPPTVALKAGNSKRRKKELLPLSKETAQCLRTYLADRKPGDPVWPGFWWQRSAEMLRMDLLNAEIEPEDDEGRVVDFHGQRTTFITGLARAGVAPATAQRLARHSDINLTMGVYTRLGMEDLAGAVSSLPELHLTSPPAATQSATPSESAAAQPQDPDLSRVVASWPRLSDPIRKAILALLAAAEPAPSSP